ncbi:hypothetical protein KJ688_03060 [bacterium]|nr:hypothetical protein [bacterium]
MNSRCIDKKGIVRFTHYGHSMSDIPENSEILEILASFGLRKNHSR